MKTKAVKRAEAEERKRLRSMRAPDEQLAILRQRGIFSGAEYSWLVGLVENGQGKLKDAKGGKA